MSTLPHKSIRLTSHAQGRLGQRGTTVDEVVQAVRLGRREAAKSGRIFCRLDLQYGRTWQGKRYAVKQVAPVIVEEETEIVVITIYVYYFGELSR